MSFQNSTYQQTQKLPSLNLEYILSKAIEIIKTNPIIIAFGALVVFIPFILIIIERIIQLIFGVAGSPIIKLIFTLLWNLMTFIIYIIVTPFITMIGLQIAEDGFNGRKADLNNAFQIAMKRAIRAFIGNLLYIIIVGIGVVCCILPGIYLSIVLMLWSPLVLLEEESGFGLKRSMELVKPQFIQFLIIGIVLGLLVVAGTLLCGIGLIIVLPIIWASLIIIYHTIIPQYQGGE